MKKLSIILLTVILGSAFIGAGNIGKELPKKWSWNDDGTPNTLQHQYNSPGIKTIKAFNSEDYESKRIDKEILNAIQSVCDEEGVPEVTDMILSLIENFYEHNLLFYFE